MSVIRLKQGVTFSVDLQYLESDRVTPKSLAGVTLYSVVRDTNFVIHAELDITVTNEAQGLYTVSAPLGTSDWPAGMLLWDVNYNNGDVEETIAIEVLRTESLSNTQIINLGSGGPVNILNDVNFAIDVTTPGTWNENRVESNGAHVLIKGLHYQQRPIISTTITLILELLVVGEEAFDSCNVETIFHYTGIPSDLVINQSLNLGNNTLIFNLAEAIPILTDGLTLEFTLSGVSVAICSMRLRTVTIL